MLGKLMANVMRVFHALRYSIDGVIVQWRNECAFRQECYLFLVMVPIILLLHTSPILKLMLVLLLMLVLVVETINSAIETIVDRISLDKHEQSKIAKDLGSAAVGLTLLMNVLAWAYTLISSF